MKRHLTVLLHLVITACVAQECEEPTSLCTDTAQLDLEGYPVCNWIMKKSSTQKQPKVLFDTADTNKFYTLIMMDPDVPSPNDPHKITWLHWLVINIKGSTLKAYADLKESNDDVKIGPSPPMGVHRYKLMLFQQDDKINDVKKPKGRSNFNVEDFMDKYKLCQFKAGYQYKVDSAGEPAK